jgi:Protein of unknown function (DUF1566)/Collagen triple helix repeat (20 copies)
VGIVGVSLIGPQGAAGAAGPQGPAGAQGLQGLQGLPGTNGTNGTNGLQGVPGTSGANYTIPNARVIATGQVKSYAVGDDGDWMPGASAASRFFNNNDGTVKDNLTGLIWLTNANCFGAQTWAAALTSANTLASPACGLTDGSVVGQWRLPNRTELMSLMDLSKANPALPTGNPFTTTVQSYYGSSYAGSTANVWYVDASGGGVNLITKTLSIYVWPVRAGQ